MYDIRRAEIWIAHLKDKQTGLTGIHPVIAISNGKCLEHSPYIQIVPISSKILKGRITHLAISNPNLQKGSVAVAEAIQRVSKKQLKYKVGHLSNLENIILDGLIQFQLGLLSFDELENIKTIAYKIDDLNNIIKLYEDTNDKFLYRELICSYNSIVNYCNDKKISMRNWWIKGGGVYGSEYQSTIL